MTRGVLTDKKMLDNFIKNDQGILLKLFPESCD